MRTRRRLRRPYVLTLHTSHFLMRAGKPAWRSIFRRIVREADYLLATSEEIRQVALELFPHSRSETMTNAVDTERFVPGPSDGSERRRIIVPRRLFPKNGVEYFVRAMPFILREVDVEAMVVGDGPERERLKQLVEELGVGDRIEFLGAQSNDQMPGLLGEADVAVIPSLIEATSIAALEAMSCELPVAASAVGGLPDIIDGAVGALFEPKNPEALSAAVVALLRRDDLAALGREDLEIYSELLDEAKADEE